MSEREILVYISNSKNTLTYGSQAPDFLKLTENATRDFRTNIKGFVTVTGAFLIIKDDKVLQLVYKKHLESNSEEQLSLIALEEGEEFTSQDREYFKLAEYSKISNLVLELKNDEKIDLCFLADITATMGPHVRQVKSIIKAATDALRERKLPNIELRCAFIGYRDFENLQGIRCNDQIIVHDFTQNSDEFDNFISKMEFDGGWDAPEDVFGGLEYVPKLNWKNKSRTLFHIADAPCHGKVFHDFEKDNYPEGDPKLKIKDLLFSICQREINYYFCGINETTNKMIEVFNSELDLIKTEFEDSNDANLKNIVIKNIVSYNINQASGLFQLITTSLTATIINNQSRTLQNDNEYNTVLNFGKNDKGNFMVMKKTIFQKINGLMKVKQVVEIKRVFIFNINAVEKSNGVIYHYFDANDYKVNDLVGKSVKFLKNKQINKKNIDFSDNNLKEHNADIIEFKFSANTKDIQKIKQNFDNNVQNEKKIEDFLKVSRREAKVKICESPFAKGNLRYAYASKLEMPDKTFKKFVAKNSLYIDENKDSYEYRKKEILLQLVAKSLAEEFLNESESEMQIKVLDVYLVLLHDTREYYTIEEYLSGSFKKWSGSLGIIDPTIYSNTLVSFQHWVYERTGNYMVVTDLQGFIDGDPLNRIGQYILTDPAISSVDMKFKPTDLGQYGIIKFFEKHECNTHCDGLKLNRRVVLPNGGNLLLPLAERVGTRGYPAPNQDPRKQTEWKNK